MRVFDLLKSVIGNDRVEHELVGTIVEGPTTVGNDGSADQILVFRLDSRPDIEFHQEDRPLASRRRRGDRVLVHYSMDEGGVAKVSWMESAA
jgi:hypothetical protein